MNDVIDNVFDSHFLAASLGDENPVALSVAEITEWRKRSEEKSEQDSRLLLPPIQRSMVWSNEQIINYWDSLLRGYPPGTMMVHRALKTSDAVSDKGLDANGKTINAGVNDFQLFDGQQRMAAILLGFGIGQHKASRRLWVDIGTLPTSESGLKFQLRITTPGQPFGYRPESPNQKVELGKRQKKWEEWRKSGKDRKNAFEHTSGEYLIDAKCAIPLHFILESIKSSHKFYGNGDPTVVKDLFEACKRALDSKVILQTVPEEIVRNPDEYIRFFGRIGQGGSRLSEDELTYSIIKQQNPEVRNRIEEIMRVAGRLIDEVDLVLAALRVARATRIQDGHEWEIIGRPNPGFASRMHTDNKLKVVKERFDSLLSVSNSKENGSELQQKLVGIREALIYDKSKHPSGIPAILLARLPNELVDVLLMFSIKYESEIWMKNDRGILTSFALYWLFFVINDSKAAWRAYSSAKNKDWRFGKESIEKLIEDFEKEGASNPLPDHGKVDELLITAGNKPVFLYTWSERFAKAGKDAESLRVLSTNRERIVRSLLWLQRDYIAQAFPDYDPTSGRDEDLPIDLDHIVPQAIFDFNWRERSWRIEDEYITDNFRHQRSLVGNSLGNFRWIDSTVNRSRQDGKFVPLDNNLDLVCEDSAEHWNSLIQKNDGSTPKWGKKEISNYQYLIDKRTIYLYSKIIGSSGIGELLPRSRPH